MNLTEFEALRDVPDKVIKGDIRFTKRQATAPVMVAEGIPIENGHGTDLRLNITYNPEVGSKTFNVHVPGLGPICRLDIDGTNHRDAGRSHKHALRGERCPDRNLPDNVVARSDMSGRSVKEAFDEFCKLGQITLKGTFFAPDEGPT